MKAAQRFGKRVLIASTSEVYGKGLALPFREDADLVLGPPDKTRWGYATSKLLDEFLALATPASMICASRWFDSLTRSVHVRAADTEWYCRISSAGHSPGEPITIHGDGSQTRSFTWVGDVVWAMQALINEPRASGQVFNIGNGQEISIRDLALKVIAQ